MILIVKKATQLSGGDKLIDVNHGTVTLDTIVEISGDMPGQHHIKTQFGKNWVIENDDRVVIAK